MFLVYLPTWLGHKLGWMLVNIPAPWSIWVGLVFMIYEYSYTDVYECWCMFFGFITVAFEYDFFVDFDHGFHPSSCRNGFGWQASGETSRIHIPKNQSTTVVQILVCSQSNTHQISISSWRCHIRFFHFISQGLGLMSQLLGICFEHHHQPYLLEMKYRKYPLFSRVMFFNITGHQSQALYYGNQKDALPIGFSEIKETPMISWEVWDRGLWP